MTDRRIAYVKTGPTAQLAGAWCHPEAPIDDIFSPERYEHMAKVLEAARAAAISRHAGPRRSFDSGL
ncbi:MAG: hypothetical protein J2P48_01990 [Alphaproteobacteria bacterium]|nr:hypothetical protein [Alphaproteobacteria bacterium]